MDPVLIGLGVLYLMSRSKPARVGAIDDQAAPPASSDGSTMSDAPPTYAYLYQLPQDSFSTTRMAIGPQGQAPVEMGLFGSATAAIKLASDKGWRLAWDGVRQLSTRPGT